MHHAFNAMTLAAENDGLSLTIASGFRDFERQLSIWNNKFTGKISVKDNRNNIVEIKALSDKEKLDAILLFSALPGASRHHWGTDIDVYAENLLSENQSLQLETWEYESNGPFTKLSQWLALNSSAFDFYFPYDKYRGGVAVEPWHLSYAPLAEKFQHQLSIELLSETIVNSNIQGKKAILNNLDDIFNRYIINVGEPNNE